jgi:hypothetical protein
MFGKSRITFFFFNFLFSYLNLILHDFSASVGNPDSGTQFIPNSDQLPEKIAHMGSRQNHPTL